MSLSRAFQVGKKGLKIPAVGLGTWKSQPGEVRNAVKVALDTGYRHIDCAWAYKNEKEVGQGLKDAGIDREKVWLTSKLWNSFHRPEQVKPALKETLDNLGVGHLDLYLMHWPVAFSGTDKSGKNIVDWDLTNDVLPTWRALEELVEEGKVKNIGISNFTVSKTKKLLEKAKIKPAVNQVELNLHCAQYDLVKVSFFPFSSRSSYLTFFSEQWHQDNGVLIESYSPLGSTGAPQLTDPVVVELAKKYETEPANILISWQVARGVVVLPKSVTPERIRSNFRDVELETGDITKLEKRALEFGTKRTVDPSKDWGVPDLWKEE